LGVNTALSVHDVPIRLTAERWAHIVEARDELAGLMDDVLDAIEFPDWVVRGYHGALAAWKGRGPKRYLVVVYREVGETDGFVITAFLSTKARKKNKIWPRS
jgi:hypothetical protein